MFKLNINVEGFNTSEIAKRLYDNDSKGIEIAEAAAKFMDPFVPYRDGELSQTYQTESLKVIYRMPYAHKQYTHKEYQHTTEIHPNATAHWDEVAMEMNGDKLIDTVSKIIKG